MTHQIFISQPRPESIQKQQRLISTSLISATLNYLVDNDRHVFGVDLLLHLRRLLHRHLTSLKAFMVPLLPTLPTTHLATLHTRRLNKTTLSLRLRRILEPRLVATVASVVGALVSSVLSRSRELPNPLCPLLLGLLLEVGDVGIGLRLGLSQKRVDLGFGV
jgi:hypothetical protein